jgi:hypothetical protein
MIFLKINKITKFIILYFSIVSCANSKYFTNEKFETDIFSKISEDFRNREEEYIIVYFFTNSQTNYVSISTHDNLYNLKPSFFFNKYDKTILCVFQHKELEKNYMNKNIIRNQKIFDHREKEIKLDGGLSKIYHLNNNSIEEIIPNERILELSFINKIPINFIPQIKK